MSLASRLQEQIQDIRAEVGRIRRPWVPELLEYLQAKLYAAEGRADGATRARDAKSNRVEAAVRMELGALDVVTRRPDRWRAVAGVVQRRIGLRLSERGLDRIPDIKTVRKWVRRIAAENSTTVLEAKRLGRCATVSPSTPSEMPDGRTSETPRATGDQGEPHPAR